MTGPRENHISIIHHIDPTATVVHTGRIGIAVGESQVIRFGALSDIQSEVEQRLKLPAVLQQWCPESFTVHSHGDWDFLCEAKLPLAKDHRKILKQWSQARSELWTAEPWEGTILEGLKQVRPHKPIDFSQWSKALKGLKKNGAPIPISVQGRTLRKLCQNRLQLEWHLGWVHGALTKNRIREGALLSWHRARPNGRRGEDLAQFIEPTSETPFDVLIHVLKASWEKRPLVAAEALFQLTKGCAQPSQEHQPCSVSVSAHPGLSSQSLSRILGCGTGSQPFWKAARAKYRARNLMLGGVEVQVHTQPEVSAKRDDAFFLTRNRQPDALFSKISSGIKLDEEGRYSLTPERHAETIAHWFSGCVSVLDACCGCGGNAIAFARAGLTVKAVDSNPKRLTMARHNAQIYGVDKRIEFVKGSFLSQSSAASAIFLDPPWALPPEEIESWWTWAEQHFAHGAIKLPKTFSVPLSRQVSVFCTEEGYPSFIVVSWGDILNASFEE